jgi:hypothetical protein
MSEKIDKMNKPIFTRNSQVQFRNTNVGMFSGPRPSYQRYSTNLASAGVLNRTGV